MWCNRVHSIRIKEVIFQQNYVSTDARKKIQQICIYQNRTKKSKMLIILFYFQFVIFDLFVLCLGKVGKVKEYICIKLKLWL